MSLIEGELLGNIWLKMKCGGSKYIGRKNTEDSILSSGKKLKDKDHLPGELKLFNG